jgi:hypothetical protein
MLPVAISPYRRNRLEVTMPGGDHTTDGGDLTTDIREPRGGFKMDSGEDLPIGRTHCRADLLNAGHIQAIGGINGMPQDRSI